MASQKRLFAHTLVQLPAWKYLGGQAITLDGTNYEMATLPSEASIVEVRAEGGEVYFNINVPASVTSGGYIPDGSAEILGPLANLTSFSVYSATADTVAHLMYFVEV